MRIVCKSMLHCPSLRLQQLNRKLLRSYISLKMNMDKKLKREKKEAVGEGGGQASTPPSAARRRRAA